MSGSQTAADGVTRIEAATPLTRLHFFDGKYLRADELTKEQDYHRELVRLSNLAGGWGVVHGLGLGQVGAALAVTPGLAITPTGRMVLLNQGLEVPVAALVEAAAQAAAEAGQAGFGDCAPATAPPATETAGQGIFEVTVGPAQALCGTEEVFGRLCQDACQTDTARPYWREGLVLRLRPVALTLPVSSAVPLGTTHLRSQVASAYFAKEPGIPPSLLSAQGLGSTIWCGPATLYQREEVPIGLLVREGATVRVLDAWAARRERMEAQARGYWQGRMRMRPWNVFLAQILQFQCQLADLFKNGSPVFEPQPDDDCARLRLLLAESIAELEATRRAYAEGNAKILTLLGAEAMSPFAQPNSQIDALAKKLADAQSALPPTTPNRMLLNGGFVELPPAGYLPVIPGQSPVNTQLERMFGEGVALSFCTAPLDHLGHLLEEAQHMDRISLTRGLDDPARREQVEIFVPDGEILGAAEAVGGVQWSTRADPSVIGEFLGKGAKPTPGYTAGPDPAAAAADAVRDQAALALLDKAPTGGATRRSLTHGMTTTPVEGATGLNVNGPIESTTGGIRGSGKDSPRMLGVARTATAGSDGGLLAMVLHPDRSDPDADPRLEAVWVELRVEADPFLAAEGDELPAAVEVRGVRVDTGEDGAPARFAEVIAGDGRMLVGPAFQAGPGEAGRRATLRALALRREYGGEDKEPEPVPLDFQITMTRGGNGAAGTLRIEPRRLGETAQVTLWRADWGGQPRHATFVPEIKGTTLPVPPVEMTEVPGLAPESPDRLKALDALALIGEVTEDEGFAARARRKLFADAVVEPGAILLRATRELVLFRRRRRVLCTPQAPAVLAPSLERFGVMHVRVADEAAAKRLQAAIGRRGSGAFKGLDLRHVQVLRYADDQQMPAEGLPEILDAWRFADPGPRFAFGRVWERAPATGQGWQNHARLARLMDMLSPLVAPPLPPATGAVAAMPAAPAGLEDVGPDGGMLLVTLEKAEAPDRLHAVWLVDKEGADFARRLLKEAPDENFVKAMLDRVARGVAMVTFPGGAADPRVADLEAVKQAAQGAAFLPVPPLAVFAAQGAGTAAQATADHAAICAAFGLQAAAGAEAVAVADFGSGAVGASVLAIG